MTTSSAFLSIGLIAALAAVAGCGSDSTDTTGATSGGTQTGDAQTPPTGAANVEAWLKTGQYKAWKSEAAVHEARSPSPHGFNRIYSNGLIATNATGTGDWPKGSAAVKELYADQTSTTPTGYAVYLKNAADSAGGDNWYFYERVPLDSPAPHDANGVVADGDGSSGTANTICVSCHVAAGMDAMHTPSVGGRDFVYTPVH